MQLTTIGLYLILLSPLASQAKRTLRQSGGRIQLSRDYSAPDDDGHATDVTMFPTAVPTTDLEVTPFNYLIVETTDPTPQPTTEPLQLTMLSSFDIPTVSEAPASSNSETNDNYTTGINYFDPAPLHRLRIVGFVMLFVNTCLILTFIGYKRKIQKADSNEGSQTNDGISLISDGGVSAMLTASREICEQSSVESRSGMRIEAETTQEKRLKAIWHQQRRAKRKPKRSHQEPEEERNEIKPTTSKVDKMESIVSMLDLCTLECWQEDQAETLASAEMEIERTGRFEI